MMARILTPTKIITTGIAGIRSRNMAKMIKTDKKEAKKKRCNTINSRLLRRATTYPNMDKGKIKPKVKTQCFSTTE